MRKITLLLTAMLSMMAWTDVMAQDTSSVEYQDALAAIQDGSTYRIKTTVSGTDYYVTTSGTLTSVKDDAGYFTITKTSGGYFGTGFRIDTGTERFTNPPLSNNVANLKPDNYAHSTNDRADWERQILYLNGDGKYAIRSCNCQDGTSSWNDAARTHWTYYMAGDVVTPCYSYTPDYIWDFEIPPTIINVTYDLYEDGTKVSSTTVKQEANSAVNFPKSMTSASHNGLWHELFYYDYTVEGTVGDEDCTIIVTRTVKAGTVHALEGLSNNKAYNIGCKRGAFLTADGYMISTDLNATANAAGPGQFAVITYEGSYYLYSVDEGKIVKNNGALVSNLITEGFSAEDALKIEAKTDPYFLFYFTIDGTNNGLNTNGNQPLGYVINTWMNADDGNQYFMVEAADFDPTEALAALDAYFHPKFTVTYFVKDEQGNTIFTSEPQPTLEGATITTLPAEFQRPYYTYNDVDVTITEENTDVEFTATWAGPFKLSTDFANAQWQNMAMRGTWYVTSAVKDDDGAYKTQEANTMGLVEDSYQWAFIGNGYDGFKIINKAEGEGKSFGWTDETATNQGIPTIMPDGEGHHAWKIVASTNTSVPAGSFCLNVPGTTLYINQFGGKGGSVKFWNSANNVSDDGSAFTVFDVPTNFASFVANEIAPYFEVNAQYFVFTEEAKAEVGYDESYKTECPFEAYKSMKEKLTAEFIGNPTNYVLPETGYYILKNKYYGTYMGIDPSDANMYGNYKTATAAKQIVKLTKEGDATYTISLMGKYAPTTVAQSQPVTASTEAGTYTIVIPTQGYGAFQADPEARYSCLHCRAQGDIVGWEAVADASMWTVIDASSIEFVVGEDGYATMYLPFPVENGGAVPALPEALPTPVGAWTFDDANNPLAGTGTATLKPANHGTGGSTWLETKESLEAAGIEAIDGGLYLPKGSSLLMETNDGATGFDKYTVMFDICADDVTGYNPLWQNSMTDSKDGSLFIKNGQIGLGGSLGYNGEINAGQWYRVVLVIDTPNKAALYVDGKYVSSCEHSDAYNKHWLLPEPGAVFFADEDGEEKDIKVTGLRFWSVPFDEEQVERLGTVTSSAEATPVAKAIVPDAIGTWTFDNSDNLTAGTGVATMEATDGVVANEDGSVTVDEVNSLKITTNIDKESLDSYTLMMDVKFPDVARYTSLIQTDLDNVNDACLFVHNGQVGINSAGLYYHGALENDTWYRLVFVVEDLVASVYIDGKRISQASSQLEKWGIGTGFFLFEDENEDNDEGVATTTEIRFWDQVLTPSQIKALGTVGTEPNLKAYTAEVYDNILLMTEVVGTVPAYTPVVVKAAPDTYILNITEDVDPIKDNDLKGTLEPIDAAGLYVLDKSEDEVIGFYKAESGQIKAGEAYIDVDYTVKGFHFSFYDNPTGIKNIDNEQKTTVNGQKYIYNVAGQRLNKMQKGINIVNGKKILK